MDLLCKIMTYVNWSINDPFISDFIPEYSSFNKTWDVLEPIRLNLSARACPIKKWNPEDSNNYVISLC